MQIIRLFTNLFFRLTDASKNARLTVRQASWIVSGRPRQAFADLLVDWLCRDFTPL